MSLRLVGLLCVLLAACEAPGERSFSSSTERQQQALGSAVRLADINTSSTSPASAPRQFTAVGSSTLFFASSPSQGIELWTTDGTPAGTRLLRDIYPGASSSWGTETEPVVLGSAMYFAASEPTAGTELWKSDGTASGTRRIADVVPGPNSGFLVGPVVVGGSLLFFGRATFSTGIYVTDPVTETTTLVATLAPLTCGVQPSAVFSDGTRAYFACGGEPWVTDGTAAGTHLLVDIVPGNGSSNPSPFCALGGFVYFLASDSTRQLWRTDGTSAGTQLVHSFVNVNPIAMTASDTLLYLTTFQNELWVSDGTSAGTRAVASAVDRNRPGAALANSRFVFSGPGGDAWVSDGTDAGTWPLLDLPSSAPALSFTTIGSRVWFAAGGQPFRTDGYDGGTAQVAAIGSSGNTLSEFALGAGGLTYFGANPPTSAGAEPWVSDGTDAGTRLLGDLFPPSSGSAPLTERAVLGNWLLFRADRPSLGAEVWRTDGTPAGTQPLQDLEPGTAGSNPREFAVAQGKVYLRASTAATGDELWRTDGTDAGLELLSLVAGTGSPQLGETAGTELGFFATVRTATGWGVVAWTSPDAGAVLVRSFPLPTAPARSPGLYTAIGDTVYFYAWTSGSSGEVWRTDGTPANTAQVTSLATVDGNQLYSFTAFQGRLYFASNLARLMRLECSGAVTTITPNNQASRLLPVGNTLYFAGVSGTEVELWKYDGVNAPQQVIDLFAGSESGNPTGLMPWNDRVVFFSDDGAGRRLYVSDGTAAGTRPATTLIINPSTVSVPDDVVTVPGGELYVAGWTEDAGMELWEISRDGGHSVIDLVPGPMGSSPDNFAVLGSRLVFAANDGTGTEPWVVDVAGGGSGAGGSGGSAPCTWPFADAGMGGGAGGGGGGSGGGSAGGSGGSGGGAAGGGAGGAAGGSAGGAAGGSGGGDAGGGAGGAGGSGGGDAGGAGGSAGGSAGGAAGGSAGGAAGGGAGGAAGGSGGGGGSDQLVGGCGCGASSGEGLLGLLLLALVRRRPRRFTDW